MISEEQVVNSLIEKNLEWKYGSITQTGINTYYYEALVPLTVGWRTISFINGELEISQRLKRVFNKRLTTENEQKLKDHVCSIVSKEKNEQIKAFEDWIEGK